MSTVSANKQTKLTNQLMGDITDLLNTYFIQMGIALVPTIGVVAKVDKNHIGVKEMVEVVNSTIDRSVYPSGLTTRSRKRDLVMKRQIVAYICRKLKYQTEHIGRGLYINHATVTHSESLVENLLITRDPEMTAAYNNIMDTLNSYHKEKYGKDLPAITTGGNNS